MLNWEHIIFRSFYYIGLLSPFVFIACYVIICIFQYLKRKSERNQKITNFGKKYKKQNKSKYASSIDITSDNSTQSFCRNVEDTNQYLYRTNENHSEMNNSETDSINIPETDTHENLSENETYLFEEELNSQNENNNFHKELTSPKLSKSARNIQFKCRDIQQNSIHGYNSKRKQLKYNNSDNKLYTVLSNAKKDDPSIDNPDFDDKSLIIDPVEVVCKINERKVRIHDGEFESISPKNVLSNNEKLENYINSTQKYQQCGFKNNKEYIVVPIDESLLHEIHRKCPICPMPKEKKFTTEIQETECFPSGICNPQEICKHKKDYQISVFQNSNIPIAKRVLEEDQFYDLRQKFYSAENTFLNESKFMKNEPSFNTMNKNKSCSFKDKKYFEEENMKDFGTQYSPQITHVTEETGNENQTENVSSTCDSTGQEELVCNFWKSLKTGVINQKRNKAVQTKIPSVGQNTELFLQKYVKETGGLSKQNYQEAIPYIQTKQDVTKQVQSTISNKDTFSITQNQSTQTNVNKNSYTPRELSQIGITKHQSRVQSLSTQVPCDTRKIEIRTCNCQFFLPSTDYSEEMIKTDTMKPVTMYSCPKPIQAGFQYPSHEHFQSDDCIQLTENTGNIHCSNCLRPNLTMKCGNMYSRYDADCDLQNKHNYVCNPVIPVNHFENSQHLNSYNKARERQIQKAHFEGNISTNDNVVQYGRHDENKYRTFSMEKNIHQQNEHTHESANKMPVTTHQHNSSIYSTKDFNNQTNSWNDENTIPQENESYGKSKDMQNENSITQPLLQNYRNKKSKLHDIAEIDIKAAQTFEKTLISPNHAKEYSKQTSKEVVKKSNSHTEINKEQAFDKSNAEQIHAKENVLRQIKRMYSHIDQNVHDTNKNVITQVQKVLKTKGMWHSENK